MKEGEEDGNGRLRQKDKKEIRARENAATGMSLLNLEPEWEAERKLNLKMK